MAMKYVTSAPFVAKKHSKNKWGNMGPNLDYVREFVVFSESLSYTAAAKKLFIAQPTLIQHVVKLEKSLGFELVTHDRNPQITQAGTLFRIEAERILEDFDSVIERCRSYNPKQADRVRIVNNQACLDLSFLDSPLAKENDVRFAFVDFDENSYDNLGILDEDVVDFSLIVAADNEMETYAEVDAACFGLVKLPPEPCVIHASRNHPLAEKKVVTLDDLSEYTIACFSSVFYARNNESLEKRFRECGIRSKFLLSPHKSLYSILKMSTAYVCVVNSRTTEATRRIKRDDDIVAIPLDDPRLLLYPAVAYRLDNPNQLVHKYAKLWREYYEMQ